MKDHLYIKNDIFYFGRLKADKNVEDDPDLFGQLNYIRAANINNICFDNARKRISIDHGHNHDEAIIQLENDESLEHHYNEILRLFPQSQLLDEEKTKFRLIRKPLIGIGVIIFVFIVAIGTDPNGLSGGVSASGSALKGIFKALASMGVDGVLVVTVIALLLPVLSIYFKIKSAKNKRILKFKPNK